MVETDFDGKGREKVLEAFLKFVAGTFLATGFLVMSVFEDTGLEIGLVEPAFVIEFSGWRLLDFVSAGLGGAIFCCLTLRGLSVKVEEEAELFLG